jgi:hypothetical protein
MPKNRDYNDKTRQVTERIITLSTGVKLKCKQIPHWLISDLLDELNESKPEMPKFFDERRKIELDNPDSEDYVKKISDWNARAGIAFSNSMIIEGSELVHLPDGMPGPDDAEWLERMAAQKRDLSNKYTVYLMWVKYVAGPTNEDTKLILQAIGRFSGVREEDVDEAVDNFRN